MAALGDVGSTIRGPTSDDNLLLTCFIFRFLKRPHVHQARCRVVPAEALSLGARIR